jgi:flagellar motor switch protein FliG
MVPATAAAPDIKISGRRKAAILLVQLGAEGAANVFKHLPEEQIEKLTIEMARVRNIDAEEAQAVHKELIENALARGYLNSGGVSYAREVLEKAVGEKRAHEILGRLATLIEQTPFEFLRSTPPDQIFTFLRGEHAQTIAMVVANLPTTDLAAKVMQLMPPEIQAEVALRVATMGQTSPDVVKEVAAVMRDKLQTVLQQEYAAAGGVQSLADILNAADRGTERNVLETLAETSPDLADEVRALLFTFEDLLQLESRAIQLVLKEVETKDLALALRGASEDVAEVILMNMSQRGAEMLKEEMELMPPQRRRLVEEAQSKIVAAVRRLEDAGEITIARAGSNAEDELVG